ERGADGGDARRGATPLEDLVDRGDRLVDPREVELGDRVADLAAPRLPGGPGDHDPVEGEGLLGEFAVDDDAAGAGVDHAPGRAGVAEELGLDDELARRHSDEGIASGAIGDGG